jgi:glutathione reductase (NADPH)
LLVSRLTKRVIADEYQNTNIKDIYATGDVAGKALLTPVAIAAARGLSNRILQVVM